MEISGILYIYLNDGMGVLELRRCLIIAPLRMFLTGHRYMQSWLGTIWLQLIDQPPARAKVIPHEGCTRGFLESESERLFLFLHWRVWIPSGYKVEKILSCSMERQQEHRQHHGTLPLNRGACRGNRHGRGGLASGAGHRHGGHACRSPCACRRACRHNHGRRRGHGHACRSPCRACRHSHGRHRGHSHGRHRDRI
jgi:hypothetical protein